MASHASAEITGFRISPVQEQVWSEQNGSARFITECALRLPFSVTAERLTDAAGRLADRYEILRTRFHAPDGRRFPLQVIAEHGTVHVKAGNGKENRNLVEAETESRAAEASSPLHILLIETTPDSARILLSLPSMAADSATLLLLAQELVAVLQGEEMEEEEVLQYAQYAEWSRQFSEEPDEEAVAFWRGVGERRAGNPGLVWRRAGNTSSVEALPVPLGPGAAPLASLAAALSLPLGDLLVGLWGAFLLQIGRGDSVEIGCDLHGREFEELAGVVGPVARSVPWIAAEGEGTAADFLRGAAAELARMREASDYYPFDAAADGGNRAAAVEIIELPDLPGVAVESIRSVRSRSPLKLSCLVRPDGTISAELLYDASLFEAGSAAVIAEMFAFFLHQIAADPNRRPAEYPLLDPERIALLHTLWNAEEGKEERSEGKKDIDEDILALIERGAVLNPEATAVIEGSATRSRADLAARAGQVAAALAARGIGRGDVVPFSLERSFDAVAVILGIMKLGAAFLPVDPALPPSRRAFMAQDSGATLVVTTEKGAEAFGDVVPTLLLSAIEETGADFPTTEADPDDPAYIIYTSGSTGTPKGCVIRRRNIAAYVGWALPYYYGECGAQGNWPLFTSLSFDLTLTSIFCSLAGGGSVTIFSEEKEMPEILREIFSPGSAVDIVKMTPAQAGLLGSVGLKRTDVRGVILGGEQLQPGQVETLRRLNPDIAIFNEYGPTETTVGCVTAKIGPEDKRVTIGRPIRGAAVYIADEAGNLLPPYRAGELWIAGAGVGAGYLNRPELTAERFRSDLPFTGGAAAYRSGDLARRYPDGQLEYLGRNDDQVKVRGYRVELGEIRGALLKLRGVRDGIVLARTAGEEEKGSEAGSELVAWYVPENGAGERTSESIREELQTILPDYMVPQFLLPVESIPLTVNGKPDTAALPDPRAERDESGYVPPRTETERTIAGIWADILGHEQVGVHDDFFRLGGHSLRAMRGIAQINMALGTDLKVGAIFEHPTVAALAELAGNQDGEQKNEGRWEQIEPTDEGDYYELSDAQRRLWVLEQMEELGDAYHIAGAFDIRGSFDSDAFAAAFRALAERHEILRTVFPVVNGTPMQQVLTDGLPEAEFIDLSGRADADAALEEQMYRIAATPFDLEAGPLFRGAVIKRSADRYRLLVLLHHIISDGWSVGILIRELVALYDAARNGVPADLPPLRIRYRDYARHQARQLREGKLAESRDYWLAKLRGASPLDLPHDMPRPQRKSYRGGTHSFTFGADTLAGLERIAAENGASLFMVLSALLSTLLHRYTGQEDITVGTAIAGRDHVDLEDQVGFYVNVLPLRTQIDGAQTFPELLARVRETATGAYAHQTYPFDRLVDELGVERETGRSPLFDIFLVLQNNERETLRFGDALLTEVPLPTTPNKYDLSFDFSEETEGLRCEVNFNADIFLPERIRNLAGHMEALARGVIAEEGTAASISSLPLLSEEERERIVRKEEEPEELRATLQRTIPELIDGIAERMPECRAVAFNGRNVSYDELRRHSNGIAALLGKKLEERKEERKNEGKEANNRIALLLPRDEKIPLLFLAVLKAGGVYVPIDADYPTERVRTILEDCDAALLITDAAGSERMAGLAGDTAVLLCDDLLKAWGRPDRPFPDGRPDDTAAILYTSGSTGRPKGVMMEHRGLVNTGLATIGRIDPLLPSSNVLQFASLSFDASLCETLSALLHGFSLVIVPRSVIDDPAAFADFIAREFITLAILPPAYLATLNRHPLPPLQAVVTAGEPPVLDDALFYARTRTYVNAYGPTECSICVTRHTVRPEGDYRMGIPIGSELPTLRVAILDRYGNPLPDGFDGEICVAGMGVGPGYLDPEQTAAAFVSHPLFPGERMYRTGDIGRRLFGGEILFRGRLDNQVKVRGHRVEPEEIAAALREHPALADAAVIARKPEGASVQLAAWVVPAGSGAGTDLSMTELRSWLAERLPVYMIPSFFFAAAELPVTPNGKVDRAALLALSEERIGAEPETPAGRPPATEEERILTEATAEVLELSHVSPEENYFMLGGDSIKAIRLTWLLRGKGYALQVRDIFAHPILADAATRLRREENLVEEEKVTGEIGLTPIQRWFFEMTNAQGLNRFNQSVLLKRREGKIDPEKLRTALGILADRHDMLRARFDTASQPPRQIVEADTALLPEVADLTGTGDREEEFRRELERTHESIDIGAPSLLKAKVIRTGDGEYLHLAAHHLVVDVVSWHILVGDLTTLLQQPEEGDDPARAAASLPPRTRSFKAWSERLARPVGKEEERNGANFWRAVAAEREGAGALPVNDAIPNIFGKTATLSVALEKEKTERLLTDANAAYNTEARDILVTALGNALCDLTGGRNCLLALEGHGRSADALKDTDVSRTVGWFTALYPVLLRRESDPGRRIRQTKETLRSIPADGIGYGLWRYRGSEGEGISDLLSGPTQIVLNYLGVEGEEGKNDLFTVEAEPEGIGFAPEGRRPFEIEIVASVRNGRFRADLAWAEGRIERELVERLAGDWMAGIALLIDRAAAVEAPELTPSDIDYDGLSLDDLDDILSGISGE